METICDLLTVHEPGPISANLGAQPIKMHFATAFDDD